MNNISHQKKMYTDLIIANWYNKFYTANKLASIFSQKRIGMVVVNILTQYEGRGEGKKIPGAQYLNKNVL